MDKAKWNRLALIGTLVKKASDAGVGRTAIMKFVYLLKELRGVPLDYRFTLYTYGPFDSRVLGDLSYAESLEAVSSDLVAYPGGYGYAFKPGPKAEKILARGQEFLDEHQDDIDWIVNEFGRKTAAELEMLSTIVYVDRQAKKREQANSLDQIANKVVEIKPHLDKTIVRQEAGGLRDKGFLEAVA